MRHSACQKPSATQLFWDRNENSTIDRPRELTSIDHVLVSQVLAGQIESVTVDHAINPVSGTDGYVTDHFPLMVNFDLSGNVAAPAGVKLVSILPNPVGNENFDETATIGNDGIEPVDISGWQLVDKKGTYWVIPSQTILQPGSEKVFKRNGQEMAMTNTGDTIELRDDTNRLIDSISYFDASEGEPIFSN